MAICRSELNKCLRIMYIHTREYYGNQLRYWLAIWGSYYKALNAKWGYHVDAAQSRISRILSGAECIPKKLCRYYLGNEGDARLRADVVAHLDYVVATHDELMDYANMMDDLVRNALSIDQNDRLDILKTLDWAHIDREHLTETVYCTLRVLLRVEMRRKW